MLITCLFSNIFIGKIGFMETHISPPLLITNFYSRKRERDFSLDFRGRKKKRRTKIDKFRRNCRSGRKKWINIVPTLPTFVSFPLNNDRWGEKKPRSVITKIYTRGKIPSTIHPSIHPALKNTRWSIVPRFESPPVHDLSPVTVQTPCAHALLPARPAYGNPVRGSGHFWNVTPTPPRP